MSPTSARFSSSRWGTICIADALDTNFENFVDVIGFFDPANTDTLEYVFDINGNGIQIS